MAASITETPNELTTDIDLASALGIVRLLRQTDSQIYNGYLGFPGFNDREVLEAIAMTIKQTRQIFASKGKKVLIISGAGTSGRLGMFVARAYNRTVKRHYGKNNSIKFLIAGGNRALLAAQEISEDDTQLSIVDLEQAIDDCDTVGYIGITCGFSAPYVASQLEWLLDRLTRKEIKGYACLMGFNPVERSRNIPIEGYGKTFLDVARMVEQSPYGIILNPIVGPEPVTGSTRMKSGTSTKLLLDMVLELSIRKAVKDPIEQIRHFLALYEQARMGVYQQSEELATLIEQCSKTISAKGRLYYVGKAPYGILGLIDASECPPTFGAGFEDIRGFIENGWESMLGRGGDMSQEGSLYRIGINEFVHEKLPHLTNKDTIIFLSEGTPATALKATTKIGIKNHWSWEKILRESQKKGAYTAAVLLQKTKPAAVKNNGINQIITPVVPSTPCFREIAMKLILNAITTGAHIRVGKVYRNRMVDLKISNNKLFFRTQHIICSIMKVDEETALEAMFRSIYETDTVPDSIRHKNISEHIQNATGKDKVVPKALLLATGKFTYKQAHDAINRQPVVRQVIQEVLAK